MNSVTYEQPREKLARKGASSLSTTELLQVIIGSGNAQTSVSKIAKKVARVLSKSGALVQPQELLSIQGVGKVKTGQILAVFELAARFPLLHRRQEEYDSIESLKQFYSDVRSVNKQTVLYVTFDGAHRLISKRNFIVDHNGSIAKQVQKVFADCITDSAAAVFIAIGHKHQVLEPGLFELNFIRDFIHTSQLLVIPIRQIVLVANDGIFAAKRVGV